MSETFQRHDGAASSRWVVLLLLVAAVASSGASCPQVLRGYQVGMMPLPRALPPDHNHTHAIYLCAHPPTLLDCLRVQTRHFIMYSFCFSCMFFFMHVFSTYCFCFHPPTPSPTGEDDHGHQQA